MNVTVLTALIEARRLIDGGWSRCTFAKDSNGHMCDWGCDAARSFCSVGAIYRAIDWRNNYRTSLCMDVFEALAKHMAPSSRSDASGLVVSFNDARGRTKEEVLDAFDRTIAAQMKVEAAAVEEAKELEFA